MGNSFYLLILLGFVWKISDKFRIKKFKKKKKKLATERDRERDRETERQREAKSRSEIIVSIHSFTRPSVHPSIYSVGRLFGRSVGQSSTAAASNGVGLSSAAVAAPSSLSHGCMACSALRSSAGT